jgi:hypothetical protein
MSNLSNENIKDIYENVKTRNSNGVWIASNIISKIRRYSIIIQTLDAFGKGFDEDTSHYIKQIIFKHINKNIDNI